MQRGDFGAELVLDAGVQVLFVLADNHQIHVGMPGVHERVVGDAGADIGVLAEGLAGGDVEALEAAALRRGDGSLEEDVGPQQGFPGARFDPRGVAAQIDLFSDFNGFDLERGARGFQNLERGVHDFGTDAISMGNCDGSLGGHNGIFKIIGLPEARKRFDVVFCHEMRKLGASGPTWGECGAARGRRGPRVGRRGPGGPASGRSTIERHALRPIRLGCAGL